MRSTIILRTLALAALTAFTAPTAVAQNPPILSAEAEFQRVADVARVAFSAGRYTEALSMTRQAHAFAAGELGPDHVLTLSALNDIAVIRHLQGDSDAALPLALRAAGGLERAAGPDHPETLNALANLAQVHVGRGERRQAEPLLRRVHEGRERTLGANHEATLNALLELAVFLNRDRRLPEIRPLLDRGAAAAREAIGPESGIALDLAAAALASRGGGRIEADSAAEPDASTR